MKGSSSSGTAKKSHKLKLKGAKSSKSSSKSRKEAGAEAGDPAATGVAAKTQEQEIAEANKLRASLGMKPLK